MANIAVTSAWWSAIILPMFVKTTRVRRGNKTYEYEYLSLVEAERTGDKVGHRTLLRSLR